MENGMDDFSRDKTVYAFLPTNLHLVTALPADDAYAGDFSICIVMVDK